MIKWTVALATIGGMLMLSSCEEARLPVPYVESVSPDMVSRGSLVKVRGTHLDYVTAVGFGEHVTTAFALEVGTHTLVVTVPPEVKTGEVDLYLISNETKSNQITIKVVASAPKIFRVTPIVGTPGEVIVIAGDNIPESPVVHFHDNLEVDDVSFVSTDTISVKIPESAQSGPLFISNADGTATSDTIYYGINPAGDFHAPTITSVRDVTGYAADTIWVIGENFYDNTRVYFSGVTLVKPRDFDIISQRELWIRVPLSATSGAVVIHNGVADTGFEFTLVARPAITKLVPEKHTAGGPIFIYGANIQNIRYIIIGGVRFSADDFLFTKDLDGQEVMYGRVPRADPGISQLQVENSYGVSSEPQSMIIELGFYDLPFGFSNVVFPNPPSSPSVFSIQNVWLTNDGDRFLMEDGSEPIGDNIYAIESGGGHAIGFYKGDGTFFSINMDGVLYEGKRDDKYGQYPYRIILTPVTSGVQRELIFPIALENVTPYQVQAGDTITITGRYFYEFEASDAFALVYLNERAFGPYDAANYPDGFVFVSPTQLKLRIPEDLSPGQYDVKVEAGSVSSEVSIDVTE